MYSRYYSSDYDPAAPVIEIRIRKPSSTTSSTTLTAMVDSGADATMIPRKYLKAVRAQYAGTRILRGVTGQPQQVDLFVVVVEIGHFSASGIRVVAIADDSTPLIGRDVLNQFIITLNGPAEVLELQ